MSIPAAYSSVDYSDPAVELLDCVEILNCFRPEFGKSTPQPSLSLKPTTPLPSTPISLGLPSPTRSTPSSVESAYPDSIHLSSRGSLSSESLSPSSVESISPISTITLSSGSCSPVSLPSSSSASESLPNSSTPSSAESMSPISIITLSSGSCSPVSLPSSPPASESIRSLSSPVLEFISPKPSTPLSLGSFSPILDTAPYYEAHNLACAHYEYLANIEAAPKHEEVQKSPEPTSFDRSMAKAKYHLARARTLCAELSICRTSCMRIMKKEMNIYANYLENKPIDAPRESPPPPKRAKFSFSPEPENMFREPEVLPPQSPQSPESPTPGDDYEHVFINSYIVY